MMSAGRNHLVLAFRNQLASVSGGEVLEYFFSLECCHNMIIHNEQLFVYLFIYFYLDKLQFFLNSLGTIFQMFDLRNETLSVPQKALFTFVKFSMKTVVNCKH